MIYCKGWGFPNEVMYSVVKGRMQGEERVAGLPVGCLYGSQCTLGGLMAGIRGRWVKRKPSLSSLDILDTKKNEQT